MAEKHSHRYSVYERGTDRPIYIHGTAAECAAALGIAVHTFHTYVTKQRKNHPQAPGWIEICFDEEDDTNSCDVCVSALDQFAKEHI